MLKELETKTQKVRAAFEKGRFAELRLASKTILDSAVLNNDVYEAELSVLAYALHKLSSKEHVKKNPRWISTKRIIVSELEKAGNALRENNIKRFGKIISRIGEKVRTVDNYLGNYTQNVYEKSKVKQASAAYAHGMSLRQAAELTGANRGNLQSYIGITKIHDEDSYALNIRQRLNKLKKELTAV